MKKIEKQFADEYGESEATCIKCDVTNHEEFECQFFSYPDYLRFISKCF